MNSATRPDYYLFCDASHVVNSQYESALFSRYGNSKLPVGGGYRDKKTKNRQCVNQKNLSSHLNLKFKIFYIFLNKKNNKNW